MHLQFEVARLGVMYPVIYTQLQSQVGCVLQSWTIVISLTDASLGIACRNLLISFFYVENEAGELGGLEGHVI